MRRLLGELRPIDWILRVVDALVLAVILPLERRASRDEHEPRPLNETADAIQFAGSASGRFPE